MSGVTKPITASTHRVMPLAITGRATYCPNEERYFDDCLDAPTTLAAGSTLLVEGEPGAGYPSLVADRLVFRP